MYVKEVKLHILKNVLVISASGEQMFMLERGQEAQVLIFICFRGYTFPTC